MLELIGALLTGVFFLVCWVIYIYEQKHPPKRDGPKEPPTDLMDWTQM